MSRAKKTVNKNIFGYIWRIGLCVLVTLLIGGVTVILGMQFILNGPESARNLLVNTFEETARGPAILRMFLDEDTILSITKRSDVKSEVDSGLIHIGETSDMPGTSELLPPEKSSSDFDSEPIDHSSEETPKAEGIIEEDGIQIIPVKGGVFKGMLMIVSDPKRVFVASNDHYGSSAEGLGVDEFIEKFNAVAGMNAGGFSDSGGKGDGGTPTGLVIRDGKIVWGSTGGSYSICGFDKNGILYVGQMTGAKALSKGIVSACSFGPALIMNGVPCNSKRAFNNGRNPRTAIGQRADGAVLLLVIEGRQLDSLGANYDELVDILFSYGAVNATNLDGGSSSVMYYKGEQIVRVSTVGSVSRGVATSILVK